MCLNCCCVHPIVKRGLLSGNAARCDDSCCGGVGQKSQLACKVGGWIQPIPNCGAVRVSGDDERAVRKRRRYPGSLSRALLGRPHRYVWRVVVCCVRVSLPVTCSVFHAEGRPFGGVQRGSRANHSPLQGKLRVSCLCWGWTLLFLVHRDFVFLGLIVSA